MEKIHKYNNKEYSEFARNESLLTLVYTAGGLGTLILCVLLGSSPNNKTRDNNLTNICEKQKYEKLAQKELCNKFHINSNKYGLLGPGF